MTLTTWEMKLHLGETLRRNVTLDAVTVENLAKADLSYLTLVLIFTALTNAKVCSMPARSESKERSGKRLHTIATIQH